MSSLPANPPRQWRGAGEGSRIATARRIGTWFRWLICVTMPALLSFGTANAATLSSKGLPKTIAIELSHTGLRGTKTDSYLITIDGTQARRGVHELPLASVTRLIAAIDEPPLAHPNLTNLGMTDTWLSLTSKTALGSGYPHYLGSQHLDANQEQYFLASFADNAVANAWVTEWSSGRFLVTDDYPSAKVYLTWGDGSSYKLSSQSQWVFMVPWETASPPGRDYNADISRGVAALLPAGALNRARMAGDNLAFAYADWLDFYLRDPLDSIRARDLFGDQLAPIEKAFEIETLSNHVILSDDLNVLTKSFTERRSLQLNPHDPAEPSDVSIYMSLWSEGDKLKMVPQAVATAKRVTALVLSVPWLSSFLEQNQTWSARIRVVQDSSITPYLAYSLLTDLRTHGKTEVADLLQPLLPQMVYLNLNGPQGAYARWFVLPDHRMLLWNYQTASPLLEFIKGAPTWDWFRTTSVGLLFSPDGKPLSPSPTPTASPYPSRP